MSIAEIKARLIALIELSENKDWLESQLNEVSESFKSRSDAWWDNLPESKREGLRRSLEQSRAGKVIPNDDVMAAFKKWL